ncbi:hypothetical protein [Poritiphilus flavus]|uniref:Uncharacterized protein n=1 Tax=Poritiphilus flavus TaxID=2697053 RepID=A0A6L9E9X9_9FLAO|nr:hypothetical protein [Poritiphilus flavus]NAS11520.1 hypothetical protein [Poritiphilus flavus]
MKYSITTPGTMGFQEEMQKIGETLSVLSEGRTILGWNNVIRPVDELVTK